MGKPKPFKIKNPLPRRPTTAELCKKYGITKLELVEIIAWVVNDLQPSRKGLTSR